MKVIISLGSRQLVVEPETEFETEVMKKYFQKREIRAYLSESGTLSIDWSGSAGEGKR